MKMRFTALSLALLLSSAVVASDKKEAMVNEVKHEATKLVATEKTETNVTETKTKAETKDKKGNLNQFLAGDVKTDLVIRVFDRFESVRDSETGKVENKLLEEKRKELTVGVQKEEQAYLDAAGDFKKKASVMNESARETESKKLVKLERNYKTKVEESDVEFKLAMNKASERLYKEVQEAVTQVAEEDNVDLMIDAATGQVAYASKRALVTQKVTNRMNKLAANKKGAVKKATSLTA